MRSARTCSSCSFGSHWDPSVYLRDAYAIQYNLREGLRTLRTVLDALPATAVQSTAVSICELCLGCREGRFDGYREELAEMRAGFGSLSFDSSR